MRVVARTDRGLRSPRIWQAIRARGRHPVTRVGTDCPFAPTGAPRRPARPLIAGPGQGWVGTGVAFGPRKRRAGALVAWGTGRMAPWVPLADLAPDTVGTSWYGSRGRVEWGFETPGSMGRQWRRARRGDPGRVARHRLVLAIATPWTVAVGTRVGGAVARAICPTRRWRAPRRACDEPRTVSLFAQGWGWLVRQGARGRLRRHPWSLPEPWPIPPADVTICYHAASA